MANCDVAGGILFTGVIGTKLIIGGLVIMREHSHNKRTSTCRTFYRGVSWFTSALVLTLLLTACGSGGGDNQPPLTAAASLKGIVTFTQDVPLTAPPADAFDGPVPPGLRYGARIVDPGDDIGGVPLPKPSTLSQSGNYEFRELDPNPFVYFNLRFTVDADLELNGSVHTPVGFNIPIALANGIPSLLSAEIDRPFDSVLQVTYTYYGPDGSREICMRLDFQADLLTFDLDQDGLFDDLIAVDANHDAIPDEHAPLIESYDYTNGDMTVGPITGIGSTTISIAGQLFEVWGSANLMNELDGSALSLAEISEGRIAGIKYITYYGGNVAMNVLVQPSPATPDGTFDIRREGLIEQISDTTIFVGGILFHDYASAKLEDILGNRIQSDDIGIGKYVRVVGERDGKAINALEIVLLDISPPPGFIERMGTIDALVPEDDPILMTLAGLDLKLTEQTEIRDLTGGIVDTGYLVVGHPAWVFAHETDGEFIADFIELQYTIEKEASEFEIVVLINDAAYLPDVQIAVDLVDTEVQIAPVIVVTPPPDPTDPLCIDEIFMDLQNWVGAAIQDLPGVVGVFPRVVGDNCEVLVLIEDGFSDTIPWVDFLTGGGIGGSPVRYDIVMKPPYYSVELGMNDALTAAEEITGLLWPNENLLHIYISPDVDFTND